jgi:predicted MFS family arabinose efflux permease
MFTASAVSVANIYYCQPLLTEIGRSLSVSNRAIGYLPMWTQAGTALGMLSLVPLGDMFPRHKLIVTMCSVSAIAVTLMAMAPNLAAVNAAGFATGLTSIVAHLILPFAAKLAPPRERGRTVGAVLSGILLGILAGRALSGAVGAQFGWRAVYRMSAGAMVIMGMILFVTLPRDRPEQHLRYTDLVRSTIHLARTQPVLREAAFISAMLFGAFSSFWATLAFFIGTPPWHYGARAAGSFGLVGAAGVLLAPWLGRLTDRKGQAFALQLALLSALVSFAILFALGYTLAGLIAGVILLDLGVQTGHVANQTRIYALIPEARSRLNTVYMVTYFLGGVTGSALGAYGWSRWGWKGVCLAGVLQLTIAMIVKTRPAGK